MKYLIIIAVVVGVLYLVKWLLWKAERDMWEKDDD